MFVVAVARFSHLDESEDPPGETGREPMGVKVPLSEKLSCSSWSSRRVLGFAEALAAEEEEEEATPLKLPGGDICGGGVEWVQVDSCLGREVELDCRRSPRAGSLPSGGILLWYVHDRKKLAGLAGSAGTEGSMTRRARLSACLGDEVP